MLFSAFLLSSWSKPLSSRSFDDGDDDGDDNGGDNGGGGGDMMALSLSGFNALKKKKLTTLHDV